MDIMHYAHIQQHIFCFETC